MRAEAVDRYGDSMFHANICLTRWLLVIGCAACGKEEAKPAVGGTAASPGTMTPVAEPPPAAEAAPSKLDVLLAKTTLGEAVELLKPDMTDTDDETSAGALLLGIWAAKHLTWKDVGLTKNETSAARVRKDSDANRGKRMCVRGRIIQIHKEKAGEVTLFTGLMLSGYTEITSFIAAGSTGELVQRSGARFCGVVTGTYDYSNSGGGKGHAISIVGMFDLPENRTAK